MTRAILAKLGRWPSRVHIAATAHRTAAPSPARLAVYLSSPSSSRQLVATRLFSTSSCVAKPVSPGDLKPTKAANITDAEYHELADEYLETLLTKYEELQDEHGDIDVEFSSGVMTIKFPDTGVYVLNKQPPNKQIWLSSPVSGPKRYDYVIPSDGQGQEQGTAAGKWIYLRDGTTLTELLLRETGVTVDQPPTESAE
ncbi:hypothetical protein AAE478_005785 [Parahypoxylon ruwenzoriense]